MIEGLFQPTHLILILAIVLIVFGPGKLPEVGSSLGKSIRDFRKSARDEQIPVFIELANETGFPHEGYIDFIDNRLDPSTGTQRADLTTCRA